MRRYKTNALLVGLTVTLYLRFGLEPTGWLFYEASFFLGLDWLYWGYSLFRGVGYALSLWPFQSLACVIVGSLVAIWLMYRGSKRALTTVGAL